MEFDTASLSGVSSYGEDLIDVTNLQKFVEARGHIIDPTEFYVEVRSKKYRTARSLIGRDTQKYIKRQPEEFDKVKGHLLEAGFDEKIRTSSGDYIPIEMAEVMTQPEQVDRDQQRFDEAMKTVLIPVTMHKYDKDGEIRSFVDGDPSMEVPKEGLLEAFFNMPMSDVFDGPKKKGCLMFSTYNGRPIVVLPSGTVVSPVLNPTALQDGMTWKKFNIMGMAYQVQKRVESKVEAMKEEENARLHDKVRDLEEKIQMLEQAKADHESGRGLHPVVPEVHAARDEYAIYELTDASDVKLITDRSKAVNLPLVTKSIPTWGKTSNHPAEDWLDVAIPRAKTAGVSMSVMHHVLLSKLEPDVGPDMYSLENLGLLQDISDFVRIFKEKYMVLSTPIQKLRELQRAQMSQQQVDNIKYMEFGNSIVKKAHKAYEGLRLRKDSWEALDRVVVTMAFLNGIPPDIANELVKEGKTHLDEMIAQASNLARINRDFRGKSVMMLGWQQGPDGTGHNGQRGNSGKTQPGRTFKSESFSGKSKSNGQNGQRPRDALCQLCRELEDPPANGYCEHCRKCFKPGHVGKDCRQTKPTQLEEARKSLKKKRD